MATLTLEKMAGRRHLRSARRRLPPLLDRRRLAGAALREDALRQRAPGGRLRSRRIQVTGRADFARVARETLDYLSREMTAPDGGFYSATDADSDGPRRGSSSSGRSAEIRRRARAPTPPASSRYYGVTPGGNFEGREHPPRRRTPTRPNGRRSTGARGALYAVRARSGRPRRATRRSSPPGTAWRSPRSPSGGRRARRAALRRRRRARRRLRARPGCAPAVASCAASRTAAPAARLPRRLRLRDRRPVRSLRGDVRSALAARGAGALPTRPSGCFADPGRAAGS